MFDPLPRRLAAALRVALLAMSIALAPHPKLAAQTTGAPDVEPLSPFTASFEVVFRGLNAGTSTLELVRDNGDRWQYVSRNQARGLFRLALPGEVRQTSVLTVDASGVRPLRYAADDGTDSTTRDIRLEFDWPAGRVRGVAEQKPVDLPLAAGLQDGMSVQLALMHALSRGEAPTGYSLIDKNEIKEYRYAFEGRTRVQTPAGEFEAVIWSSRRPNSNRITRVWYAPGLAYLPVQAERRKGDTVEWSMRLKNFRR